MKDVSPCPWESIQQNIPNQQGFIVNTLEGELIHSGMQRAF
jgi:hypothetical protein